MDLYKFIKISILNVFLFILISSMPVYSSTTKHAEYSKMFLFQIKNLLPEGYKLVPKQIKPAEIDPNGLGNKIDQIILKVLSTKNGKAFCSIVRENDNEIKNAFLVNSNNIYKFKEICNGFFSTQAQSNHKIYPKRYTIIQMGEQDFIAEGWTSLRNETVIFLSNAEQDDTTNSKLVRTLIHELAVSYDKKDQIGFQNRDNLDQFGIIQTNDSKNSIPILNDALVKLALSSSRAFSLEYLILMELQKEENGLQLSNQFKNWYENKSCIQKLEFLAPYIQNIYPAYSVVDSVSKILTTDENQNYSNHLLNILGFNNLIKVHLNLAGNLNENIKKLSELSYHFENGTHINACDYLSTVNSVIPYIPGVAFKGGPDPRIGGGGW